MCNFIDFIATLISNVNLYTVNTLIERTNINSGNVCSLLKLVVSHNVLPLYIRFFNLNVTKLRKCTEYF